MDFFPKIATDTALPQNHIHTHPPADAPSHLPFVDDAAATVQDSITSLMNMADKMEALLPPECDIHLQLPQPVPEPSEPVFETRFQDCLSSVTGATTATTTLCSVPQQIINTMPDPDAPPFKAEDNLLPTSTKPMRAPDHHFDARAQRPQPSMPVQMPLPYPLAATEMSSVSDADALANQVYRGPTVPLGHDFATEGMPVQQQSHAPALVLSSCTSSGGVRGVAGANTSPVAIRDLDVKKLSEQLPHGGAISKPRKTGRKPKTYSKPVASRFCHICSRMPRRGQGSATCKRMAEGFCRKIVCEQCLREQGWNYEDIAKNPRSWLCPHCADICPAKSQCHIYNRINARRKRSGSKVASSNGGSSVAAALASSDVLLGPYVHLFQGGAAQQILQPPPNFRLTLGPEYCIDRDSASVVVHRKDL